MKTAISVPDDVFRAAERLARRLGLSRSELFARAVALYVANYQQQDVTERINAVHGEPGTSDGPDVALAALQERSLPRDAGW